MKKYEVVAEFWRHGLLVSVGTELTLHEKEVRYISHNLKEVDETAPVEAPEVVAEEADEVVATKRTRVKKD